jgi:hypothetical protein
MMTPFVRLLRLARRDLPRLRLSHLRLLLPRRASSVLQARDCVHIATVFARVCALVPLRNEHGRVLRIAALIHERQGRRPERAACRFTNAVMARRAGDLVEHFGEAWKLRSDAYAAFATKLGRQLRAYLLFELAHEGRAPAFLPALWRAGRLGPEPRLRPCGRHAVRRGDRMLTVTTARAMVPRNRI